MDLLAISRLELKLSKKLAKTVLGVAKDDPYRQETSQLYDVGVDTSVDGVACRAAS